MATRATAFLFLALGALVSCADPRRTNGEPSGTSGAPASSARAGSIIVVLGSSTASGFGLTDPSASWVRRYEADLHAAHPGLAVKNLAVPGYMTFQVLPTGSPRHWFKPRVDPEHNVTAALAVHPFAIIVNLPSNDAAAGVSVDDTLENLHAIVDTAARAGVPTWVTTSQPRALPEDGAKALARMRARVLADFAGRALDFWKPLAAADGAPLASLNQGDGVHPNAEGHARLFEVVQASDIPGHARGP